MLGVPHFLIFYLESLLVLMCSYIREGSVEHAQLVWHYGVALIFYVSVGCIELFDGTASFARTNGLLVMPIFRRQFVTGTQPIFVACVI